jgi:hypothetical protein
MLAWSRPNPPALRAHDLAEVSNGFFGKRRMVEWSCVGGQSRSTISDERAALMIININLDRKWTQPPEAPAARGRPAFLGEF